MFLISEAKSDLEKLCDFSSIFQFYRIVDPFTHKVYKIENGSLVLSDTQLCYAIWNRQSPCKNCISIRACEENKKYVKIEYLENTVYMINALCVNINGYNYSLELISDVTSSIMVGDSFHKDSTELTTLIHEFNTLAITDSFTGLYNNHYMLSKLDYLIKNYGNVCVLVLDLDDFKIINDKNGHLIGDRVILSVASVLKKYNQLSDIFAGRMGGDEFAVIFNNATLKEVQSDINSIINKIAACTISGKDAQIKISASFGVSQNDKSDTAYSLFDKADAEMYKNKHAKKTKKSSAK